MTDEVKIQTDNKNEAEIGQKATPESELPISSQPSEHLGASEKTTNETPIPSGGISKQPTSKEDLYEESKSHKIPLSLTRICRECLQESYGGYESELRGVCQDYFKPVSNNLKEIDRLDDIIVQLILYCEKHHQFELLWGVIEKERPNNYKKYYQRWQKAVESMELTDVFEQNIHELIPNSPTDSTPQNTGDEPHPLATENSDAINKWFFSELNQQEQSFVLTVALFEGINRKLLGKLTHEIENRLFDTVQQ